MKIHAIQTGTVYVTSVFLKGMVKAGGLLPFVYQLSRDQTELPLPIYAWVIEHDEGIIVVDTGDVSTSTHNPIMNTRFDITPDQEIGAQLANLGIRPKDVSKVVLTHLHADHMNGLDCFKDNQIMVSEAEYGSITSPVGRIMDRVAIHAPSWLTPTAIRFVPDSVGTFPSSFPLTKAGDVIAVPTPGHTVGHLSVIAIKDGISYFLAGDVTYSQQSLLDHKLEGPSFAPKQHPHSIQQILDYAASTPTVYLPSHDADSGKRLANSETLAAAVPA